jgi:hypothetical protein
MTARLSRRRFIAGSLAATAAAPVVTSLEEQRLLAHATAATDVVAPITTSDRWMGTIGSVRVSRVICGGNLMGGYAHSRDLLYVSDLIKRYHTAEKMMETWALCEEHGVNTMIVYQGDADPIDAYAKYRARGGRIQYIAQVDPDPNDLGAVVTRAVDLGAVGAFLVGNTGDRWARDGAVGRVAEFIGHVKDAKLVAGVAGHELRTPRMCEAGKVDPDFYVKTFHDQSYWSKQRPDQDAEVVDNYAVDNYWCRAPEQVASFMAGVRKPWIAYKVLAAGAIPPRHGLDYAFRHGADFALVGMFDFQVARNVATAHEVLAAIAQRDRPWMT